MHRNTTLVWVITVTIAAILSACGAPRVAPTPTTDPNMLLTAAVNTVQAELTRSAALAPTSTLTPSPTPTQEPTPEPTRQPTSDTLPTPTQPAPTSTLSPDRAEFISQSVADNTKYPPGTPFTLTWKLKNAAPLSGPHHTCCGIMPEKHWGHLVQ
jgi:hypothetical protein